MLKLKKFNCVICIFLCMLMVTLFYSHVVSLRVSKLNGIKIVLDAGHGGRDGGSVGVNGTIEKEINLEYTFLLKKKLVENGFAVELTRKNDDGLYSEFAKNKKISDMNARFNLIKNFNPNLVISIHMNSFSSPNVSGPMTYYRTNDKSGKYCADLIQKSFVTYCGAKSNTSKVGDYYILNCTYYTAILIECGFISNPEEEKLLNSKEYKQTLVNAIFKGILLYFGNNSI